MKQYIMILLCIALPAITVSAQNIADDKVPAPVAKSFQAKFPKAEQAAWHMNKNKQYKVKFHNTGEECNAVFDNNGNWMQTEKSIPESQLPASAKTALQNNYSGYMITHVKQVENKKDGVRYETEIKKGESAYAVSLNEKGDVLRKIPQEKMVAAKTPHAKKSALKKEVKKG